MRMIKAVSFHCPTCNKDVDMEAVAMGEDLKIYILGKYCDDWVTVDIEKVVANLCGGPSGKAN